MTYKLLDGRIVEDENDERLTKKFGNTYSYFKNQHPDLYKLPEEEVGEICRRYNQNPYGDTHEKAVARTNNYINNQMPRWQQQYFNKPRQTRTTCAWGTIEQPKAPKQTQPMMTTFSGKPLKQHSLADLDGTKEMYKQMSFKPAPAPKPAAQPKAPQMTPMPVNTYTAQPVSYTQTQPMGFAQRTKTAFDKNNFGTLEKFTQELDNLKQRIKRFEGNAIEYPYKDVGGILSVCDGDNINDEKVFKSHPWEISEQNRLATPEEVQQNLDNIKIAPFGKDYTAEYFKNLTNIRIPKSYCNEVLDKNLINAYKELERSVPNFKRFPLATQISLVEAHFNTGSLTDEEKWRMLYKAARAYDQRELCNQLHRKEYTRNGQRIANMPERNEWAYENCMLEPFE